MIIKYIIIIFIYYILIILLYFCPKIGDKKRVFSYYAHFKKEKSTYMSTLLPLGVPAEIMVVATGRLRLTLPDIRSNRTRLPGRGAVNM